MNGIPSQPNLPSAPQDDDRFDYQALTQPGRPVRTRRFVILFLCTVLTTLTAGAVSPLNNTPFALYYLVTHPVLLLEGIPYAFSLLAILMAHEMGHYVMSRYHGVATSLPYFLPAPLFFGTFGAVIVSRSPYPNRRAIMDIGAAGPIAGFLVALPITAIGISLSTVVDMSTVETTYVTMGEPLVLQALTYLILGPLPEGFDVMIHPMAFAGWFGFLITMLNLMPISQLDGGHILYAFLGRSPGAQRLQRAIMAGCFIVMVYLGMRFMGWYVWTGLLMIMSILFRFRHPPSMDDITPLDPKRRIIGVIAVIILIVTFIPVPLTDPLMP